MKATGSGESFYRDANVPIAWIHSPTSQAQNILPCEKMIKWYILDFSMNEESGYSFRSWLNILAELIELYYDVVYKVLYKSTTAPTAPVCEEVVLDNDNYSS